MPLTADEFVTAIEQHQLSIVKHRTDPKYRVIGSDGGRLSQWQSTPTAAVEEAIGRLSQGELRDEGDRQALAFRRLRRGIYYQRSRDIPVTNPITGEPAGTKTVWDIRRMSDNLRFVEGADSLLAAIVQAEQIIAAQGQNP